MLMHKFSFTIIFIVNLINILDISPIFPMKQPPTAKDALNEIAEHASNAILRVNEALGLAHSSNGTSIEAFKLAQSASTLAKNAMIELEKVQASQTNLSQQIPAAIANLEHEYSRLSRMLAEEAAKARSLELEDKLKIEETKIKLKESLGVFERAKVAAIKENWKSFRETIGNSSLLIKIALAIVVTAVCIYAIKYGMPALIDHFTKPYAISETSKTGLLQWFTSMQDVKLDDLIFTPSLQKQLSNLTLRVQSAKQYKEALPNVLFYGAPGAGKTAFAKALAIASGLDYALTSGSEFAKIKNLNDANNELRKLLNWAKKSKGLIIFIDEAESLFANRKLSTTPKATQDFINTFLSLVSDQSQQNVMFIFATNHPSKLDSAVTNRIGINVEFTLPEATERTQILFRYLVKFAQTNEEAIVTLHPEISQMLAKYASNLNGFSPRAIKFVAETMIINARRQKSMQLTNDIAQAVIDEAKHNLQEITLWKEG